MHDPGTRPILWERSLASDAWPLVTAACRVAVEDVGRARIVREVDELVLGLCGSSGGEVGSDVRRNLPHHDEECNDSNDRKRLSDAVAMLPDPAPGRPEATADRLHKALAWIEPQRVRPVQGVPGYVAVRAPGHSRKRVAGDELPRRRVVIAGPEVDEPCLGVGVLPGEAD